MRQGFVTLFAQHLLGVLDFAQDPMDVGLSDISLCETTSSFMKQFFTRMPPQNFLWFQAFSSGSGQVETVSFSLDLNPMSAHKRH